MLRFRSGPLKYKRLTVTDILPVDFHILIPVRSVVLMKKSHRMPQLMNQSTSFTRGLPDDIKVRYSDTLPGDMNVRYSDTLPGDMNVRYSDTLPGDMNVRYSDTLPGDMNLRYPDTLPGDIICKMSQRVSWSNDCNISRLFAR